MSLVFWFTVFLSVHLDLDFDRDKSESNFLLPISQTQAN